MAWIKTIEYGAATGKLKKLYDRIKGPGLIENIDNTVRVHFSKKWVLVCSEFHLWVGVKR